MKSCFVLKVVLISSLYLTQAQTSDPRLSHYDSRRRYYYSRWPRPYPVTGQPLTRHPPLPSLPPAPAPVLQETCNAATLNNSEADAIRNKLKGEGMWTEAAIEKTVLRVACTGRRKRQTQMNGCCIEECALEPLRTGKNAFGKLIPLYRNGANSQYFHVCNCKTAACAEGCRCEQGERATLAQTGAQTFAYVWVPCCCRSVATRISFRDAGHGRGTGLMQRSGVTPSAADAAGNTDRDIPPEGTAHQTRSTGDRVADTTPQVP